MWFSCRQRLSVTEAAAASDEAPSPLVQGSHGREKKHYFESQGAGNVMGSTCVTLLSACVVLLRLVALLQTVTIVSYKMLNTRRSITIAILEV